MFKVNRRAALGAAGAAALAWALPQARAQGAARDAGKGAFKVVTTFTVIADMARNVAGDAAQVESITRPGAEIHEYQPTPGDLLRAQGAQLVLWNGLNLERWFERFFRRLKGVPEAVVSQGVAPMGIGEGPYEGKPNPHAWMSPAAAQIYVDNIARALAAHDSAHAQTYLANAAAYKQRIEQALTPVRQAIEQLPPEARWLATSEGAFSYLARDLGLKELYLWPINADQQGTPQQVRRVIETARQRRVPAIFSESTVSPKPAQQVAREAGIHYGGVLYVDSLTAADGPAPTYLDLLRVTCETIVRGLQEGVRLQQAAARP